MSFEPGWEFYYHQSGKCVILRYLPVLSLYSCLNYFKFCYCYQRSSSWNHLPSSCVLDIPVSPVLLFILIHPSLEKNLVVSEMPNTLYDLVLLNLSLLTCETFSFLRSQFFCCISFCAGKMKLIFVARYFVAAR